MEVEDGVQRHRFENDIVVEVKQDGSRVQTEADGTVTEISSSGRIRTTDAEGNIIIEEVDGTVKEMRGDNIIITKKDGRKEYTVDGVNIVQLKEGWENHDLNDGSLLIFRGDYSAEILADGTIIERINGEAMQTEDDGTTVWESTNEGKFATIRVASKMASKRAAIRRRRLTNLGLDELPDLSSWGNHSGALQASSARPGSLPQREKWFPGRRCTGEELCRVLQDKFH